MKRPVFTGAAVAIITPMNTDGSVNYDELGRIIDDQIAHSTDAIVICGTTGESPTLTDEEHTECIRYTVKKVAGRVPVIAGTGSNDTKSMPSGCPSRLRPTVPTHCCWSRPTTTRPERACWPTTQPLRTPCISPASCTMCPAARAAT